MRERKKWLLPLELVIPCLFIAAVLTSELFYRTPTQQFYPTVLGRSYPVPFPDIYAGEGKTITLDGATIIVSPDTFNINVYLRVDRHKRVTPKQVQGLWQVSDLWQVRFRTHEKDDELKPVETKKKYIISFPYTTESLLTDQGIRFSEDSLAIARGETESGPWSLAENAVIDNANRTISTLTKEGGFYMVVAGNRQLQSNLSTNNTAFETESEPTTSEIDVSPVFDEDDEGQPEEVPKVVYIVVTPTPLPDTNLISVKGEGIITKIVNFWRRVFAK